MCDKTIMAARMPLRAKVLDISNLLRSLLPLIEATISTIETNEIANSILPDYCVNMLI